MYIKTQRRMKGNCRKNTCSMSFGVSIDSIVHSPPYNHAINDLAWCLKTAQEVRLPNLLSSSLACALRDLGPLVETRRSFREDISGFRTVVGRGRDIGSLVVDGDLRGHGSSLSSELLFQLLPALLIQSCSSN